MLLQDINTFMGVTGLPYHANHSTFPAVKFMARDLCCRLADSVDIVYVVEPGVRYTTDEITNLLYEIATMSAALLPNLLLPQNGPIIQSPEGLAAHKAAITNLAALFGELAVATLD